MESWSAEEVRQWLAGLEGTSGLLLPDMAGAQLVKANMEDLVSLGLTKAQAERVVEELKLVCDKHRDIPNEFLCPITCDIMSDPVQCSDGFMYERTAIKEWLMTRRNTSPMTNLEMTDASLIPCDDLRKKINDFLSLK